VVLAASGLAFAAGVLGLLRVASDPGGGGPVAGAAVGDGGTTGAGYGSSTGDDAGGIGLATNAAVVPAASAGPGDTR